MKYLCRLGLLVLSLLTFQVMVYAQTDSITTTFASDNGCAGNFFNITATNSINITSFDINIRAALNVSVYYRTDTHVGAENSSAGWTLLGSAAVSGTEGNPTTLPVGGVTVPAGETYSFLVQASSQDIRYTDGANTYSNADLEITTNTSTCNITPFTGGLINSRTWNGTIYYVLNADGTVTVIVETMPLPAFYDGRINDYDTATPVAIFPHFVNGETGLIIYSPDGVQLMVVSPQQIADAPDNPEGNVEVASANGVTLYRIGEGRGYWQINAPQYNGKTYVMIFPELFHSGGYESFELEG